MIRVGEYSTLAVNYLLKRLEAIGCQAAYPERRASHEFILTFAKLAEDRHVTALDIAKRLLDYNQHTPTIGFPLLVPECFLIEPTETNEAMDDFVGAMAKLVEEAKANPETIQRRRLPSPYADRMRSRRRGIGCSLKQVLLMV
ncbi:hypothetical protein ACLD02_17985 [Alloalcanivorax sp. C16-2]|uniref:hypothetical protein n=1 Tax=Alloalcanivorax sp. C16-2 TaxID=3390052 RepID=UPI003970D427